MPSRPKDRDMTGTGRYPPTPRHTPLQFYSAVRMGDPEMLAKIMAVDPYFVTQDNGAGAPIHFATTYCQLDMVHHLLNQGAEVNQRDHRGFTPLHRAALLAHLPGYMELYEYLLSRGADPRLAAVDIDKYLEPGPKLPVDMTVRDDVAGELRMLEARYVDVAKAREPHPSIGDWWALYDCGLDTLKTWAVDWDPDFPEERLKKRERTAAQAARAERKVRRDAFLTALAEGGPTAARAVAMQASVTTTGVTSAGAGAASAQVAGAVPAVPAGASSVPFTAALFPGQGSQCMGMLRDTSDLPAVKAMLATAQHVLGYDLLSKCLNGPAAALDSTEVAQPALLVASLAAAHASGLDLGSVGAAAGLSVGEYAALVWAGALSFEDGLKVVKARGEAMARAAEQGPPHGMLSVVGLDDDTLTELCTRVCTQVHVEGGCVCQVANYLFPKGRVVSGHTAALNLLNELALGAGALKAQMLAVSGAFHTRLMQPAQEALTQVLSSVDITAPQVTVYSNVTAQPFPSDPEGIRSLLAQQLVQPVKWEASLTAVLAAGKQHNSALGKAGDAPKLYELGPGQQIKAMVRRISNDAWKVFTNVAA